MAPKAVVKSYREIDHSGDVGIEAWGNSAAELMENLTRGLFGLFARATAEHVLAHDLEVVSKSESDLVVDWLSEVIAMAAANGVTYSGVVVKSIDRTSARGTLLGEATDPARHDLRFDVKAATYHGLVFERTASGYHACVIFDL